MLLSPNILLYDVCKLCTMYTFGGNTANSNTILFNAALHCSILAYPNNGVNYT